MGKRRAIGLPYTEITPLAKVHEVFAEKGFAIIDEIKLSEAFCEEAKSEVWQALEAIITRPTEAKIRRNDRKTYPNFFKLGPLHSMILQHLGFAQMPTVWKAREAAAPIFAHLWGVKETELITSMDAISFNIAPEKFPGRPVGQFYGGDQRKLWWHTDQAIINTGGHCIQGYWNLDECGPNEGCLSALEGSHKFHKDLRPMFYADTHDDHYSVTNNWHRLSADEMQYMEEEKGCQWRFICAPKGAFVIWDSRTVHMGTEPRLPRPEARDRLVYYVCMLPKQPTVAGDYSCAGIRPEDVQRRLAAFEEHRVTSHWPYPIKLFDKFPRHLSKDITVDQKRIPRMMLADMSPLQKSLLGL